MLVLPIVNRNRILNVRVSIKDASKVRTGVRLDNTMPSDIIVNGRSFLGFLYKYKLSTPIVVQNSRIVTLVGFKSAGVASI